MTMPETGGWAAMVERGWDFRRVNLLLARRTHAGYSYVTTIDGATGAFDQMELVEDGQPRPEAVRLSLNEDAARALYDALAQHFAGEAGGRQTRADLVHERGRVDKMIDALIGRTS